MIKSRLSKIVEWGIYLLIFLLPWQIRLIWKAGELAGGFFEYGTFSLYGTELLLLALVVLNLIKGDRGDKGDRGNRGVKYFVALFFVVCCLSIFWAGDSDLALYKFVVLLEGFMFFWLILTGGVKKERVFWAIVLSAAVQAGVGIWQFLGQEIVGNKWLGMASQNPADGGVSVVETVLRRWLRAHGTLMHPNIFGGWIVIGLVCCLGLYERVYRRMVSVWGRGDKGDKGDWGDRFDRSDMDARLALRPASPALPRRGRQRGERALGEARRANDGANRLGGVGAVGLMLGFVVMVFGLLASFSRGAWVAVIIVTLLHCYIVFARKDKIGMVVISKMLIIILLVVAMFGLVFREPFLARVRGEGRLEAQSVVQRASGIKEGWGVVRDNWLGGVGLGNYTLDVYRSDRSNRLDMDANDKMAWEYQPVHNLYLLVWAELGVFGLVFFLAIIGWSFIKKNSGDGWAGNSLLMFLAVIILAFFDHYFWSFYFGVMVWWLILGVSVKGMRSGE